MVNKLIQGNNLEILKSMDSNFIDATITSPPYNKGEGKNSGKILAAIKYDSISDDLNEHDYQKSQIEIIDELFRVTKPGGHLFYNHKVRYMGDRAIFPSEWLIKTKWLIRQEIVWDRKSTNNPRGWRYWNVDERIYWLYKKKNDADKGEELSVSSAGVTNIWRISPERNNVHPAPFPIDLPKKILRTVFENQVEKIILDPYIGSGTTAIAAKELGHSYIGIDISEKYLEMAKERIDGSLKIKNSLDNFIQF